MKKYKDFVYLICFLIILVTISIVKSYYEKNENRKQEELINDFIMMEFCGIVNDYERVPRGINILVDNEYVCLGIEGISLDDNISINDSIVKIRGNSNYFLYKMDKDNLVFDTIIIRSGY